MTGTNRVARSSPPRLVAPSATAPSATAAPQQPEVREPYTIRDTYREWDAVWRPYLKDHRVTWQGKKCDGPKQAFYKIEALGLYVDACAKAKGMEAEEVLRRLEAIAAAAKERSRQRATIETERNFVKQSLYTCLTSEGRDYAGNPRAAPKTLPQDLKKDLETAGLLEPMKPKRLRLM